MSGKLFEVINIDTGKEDVRDWFIDRYGNLAFLDAAEGMTSVDHCRIVWLRYPGVCQGLGEKLLDRLIDGEVMTRKAKAEAKVKRAPGLYWVQFIDGHWAVAAWAGRGCWDVPGYDGVMLDPDFRAIGDLAEVPAKYRGKA